MEYFYDTGFHESTGKKEAAPGLWLEDVPQPEPGINDVLIRVLRTAICGTDMHIYQLGRLGAENHSGANGRGPRVCRRNCCEVGSNVNDLAAGTDRLRRRAHVVCGRCRNCMAGRRHLCNQTRAGIGVDRPGAFAEYHGPAHVQRVGAQYRVSTWMSAALFDPFGNAVHTALQYDLLGEDVLITGAGPIGAMAAAVCKSRRRPSRGDY